MPFLIRERFEMDGVRLIDRTSPVDTETVERVEKTVRLDGREVKVVFEFDPPLVVPRPKKRAGT